jgi:hypothetical protein
MKMIDGRDRPSNEGHSWPLLAVRPGVYAGLAERNIHFRASLVHEASPPRLQPLPIGRGGSEAISDELAPRSQT